MIFLEGDAVESAKWIPWAKNRLAALRTQMRITKTPSAFRNFPLVGVDITIHAMPQSDVIKIATIGGQYIIAIADMGYYREQRNYKINLYSDGKYLRTFGDMRGIVNPMKTDIGDDVPSLNNIAWYPAITSFKGSIFLVNVNVYAEYSIKGELLNSVDLGVALGVPAIPDAQKTTYHGHTTSISVTGQYVGITSTLDWTVDPFNRKTRGYIFNRDMTLKYSLAPSTQLLTLCMDDKFIYAAEIDIVSGPDVWMGLNVYDVETGDLVFLSTYLYIEYPIKMYVQRGRLYVVSAVTYATSAMWPYGQHGNLTSFRIDKDSEGNIVALEDDIRYEVPTPVLITETNGSRTTWPAYHHAPDGSLFTAGRHGGYINDPRGLPDEPVMKCGFYRNAFRKTILRSEDPDDAVLSMDNNGNVVPIDIYIPKNTHYGLAKTYYDVADTFTATDAEPIYLPSDITVVSM